MRALREVRGWSRERLAKEAGIAVGTLARLESEGAIQPGFFTGGAVAEALEGSLDELFRRPWSLLASGPLGTKAGASTRS